MKEQIPIRITVLRPLKGVTMMVQRGRSELLAPKSGGGADLIFEFEVTVDLSAATPNFLGAYAQGPKDVRFIYVNSGRQAGQLGSCWDRRAKITLMTITREQVETVLAERDLLIETGFEGTGGRDGGPTCAGVKGLEWRVAGR
jgi:Family of unknown function (DUF5990)